MDNLKRPSSPQPIAFCGDNSTAQTSWGVHEDFAGFIKLELASLMIAQGFISSGQWKMGSGESSYFIEASARIGAAVLREANK